MKQNYHVDDANEHERTADMSDDQRQNARFGFRDRSPVNMTRVKLNTYNKSTPKSIFDNLFKRATDGIPFQDKQEESKRHGLIERYDTRRALIEGLAANSDAFNQ